MSKDIKKKQWYRLPNGVEYSKDFKFFVENQIKIVKRGKLHKFCSRLESKTFKEVEAMTSAGVLLDSEIRITCAAIQMEIFAGKHGEGVLTD
jgi:hypothetical protein